MVVLPCFAFEAFKDTTGPVVFTEKSVHYFSSCSAIILLGNLLGEFFDMKVLVLSHLYPSTANEVAGIFVHDQVKALVKKGVEVRVVSPVPWAGFPVRRISSEWEAYSKIPSKQTWDGIEVYYPRYLVFPRAKLFASSGRRLYGGVRGVVESIYSEFPFDLIHAHVALPDGYGSALLSDRLGVPFVVTIHGQDFYQTIYRSSKSKQSVSFVLRRASRVILVSHVLKKLARKHFEGIDNKLEVISNGVDPAEIVSIPYGKKNSGEYSPIIVSVSNLIKRKGIDINIRAIALLKNKYPNLQYWIVGGGPEMGALRDLASRLDMGHQVHFWGRQSHRQALELVARADVFSMPSWDEAFGVVYIEAMALGKPVVGCQNEGPSDFVDHGRTGMLVKCKDIDNLAETLDFLLNHPQQAIRMGKQARDVVLQNFTWEKNAEKNLKVYQEVVSEQ